MFVWVVVTGSRCQSLSKYTYWNVSDAHYREDKISMKSLICYHRIHTVLKQKAAQKVKRKSHILKRTKCSVVSSFQIWFPLTSDFYRNIKIVPCWTFFMSARLKYIFNVRWSSLNNMLMCTHINYTLTMKQCVYSISANQPQLRAKLLFVVLFSFSNINNNKQKPQADKQIHKEITWFHLLS